MGAGLFYEGLLFAREQRLPVVAVAVTAGDAPPLFDAGIPAYSADGKDILDVYRWTRQAAEEARSGGGPRMVHLRLWKPEEDPVERYRKVLQLEGLMDEGEQRAIEASARGGRA